MLPIHVASVELDVEDNVALIVTYSLKIGRNYLHSIHAALSQTRV